MPAPRPSGHRHLRGRSAADSRPSSKFRQQLGNRWSSVPTQQRWCAWAFARIPPPCAPCQPGSASGDRRATAARPVALLASHYRGRRTRMGRAQTKGEDYAGLCGGGASHPRWSTKCVGASSATIPYMNVANTPNSHRWAWKENGLLTGLEALGLPHAKLHARHPSRACHEPAEPLCPTTLRPGPATRASEDNVWHLQKY
eukprot:165646-Chlamydomonas_euryale.AAC.5